MNDAKPKILVVDDEKTYINVIVGLLSENYRVFIAKNGRFALKKAKSEPKPDLILLDVMMPKMNGYEVLTLLKADGETKDIPVIFLTAKSEIEDEKMGFDIGAVDYITKPIRAPILLTRIETHLRLKNANDQLRNQAVILDHLVQERTRQLSLINQALSKFVPNAFLEAMGKKNILELKLGDHMYGEMTILFSDIRSYTTLSESMTPQQVFNFANAYHNRMTPIIRNHNGFVQQIQGDGVLSVFPESACDAVEAGISIQKKVIEYNKSRINKNKIPIRVGVGMHSGPLMVGIIGDDERWESGVHSDTVNTAARMEGMTKYYGVSIVVSETVVKNMMCPAKYLIRFLDKVRVKGKTDPLKVYEIFNTDPEDLIDKKLRTSTLFSEGQMHYYSKNFREAVKCFTDVLTILPNDVSTRQYIKEASKYLYEGVPENWDGIRNMSEK